MNKKELQEIYAALSAPFPESAVQRTRASDTKKGYDTSGIGYQFIANRMNEVLGSGGFRTDQVFDVTVGEFASKRAKYTVVCELKLSLGEWLRAGMTHGLVPAFFPFAEAFAVGGHESVTLADAKKGAYTNAFKKAAGMLGIGRQAYEGTLDDDNGPSGESPPPRRTTPYTPDELRTILTDMKTALVSAQGPSEAAAIWEADVKPRIEGLDKKPLVEQSKALNDLDAFVASRCRG